MKTVLHLFRKDCAAMRSWLVGWTLLNVMMCAMQLLPAPDLAKWFEAGQRRGPVAVDVSPDTAFFALLAVMAVLTIWRVIHLDALGHPRAFWPTRPPGSLRLLAAKSLFVSLWLFALPGLLQGFAFVLAGFGEWAATAWWDWFFMQSAVVGFACAVGVLTRGPRSAIAAAVLSIGAVVWLQGWINGQPNWGARWTLLNGQAGAGGAARFAVALMIVSLGGLGLSIGRYWCRHSRVWYVAAFVIALLIAAIAHTRWPGKLALLNRPKRAPTDGPPLSVKWARPTNGWPRLSTGSVGATKWSTYSRVLRVDGLADGPAWWAELRPDWSLTFADGTRHLLRRSGRNAGSDLFYEPSDRALRSHLGVGVGNYYAKPSVAFFTETRGAVEEMQRRRIVLSGTLEIGGLANPIIHEVPLEEGAGFRHGPFRWRIGKVIRAHGDLAFGVLGEEPMWLALGTLPSWHGPRTDGYRYRPYLWNKALKTLVALHWGRRADRIDTGRRKRFFADRYSLHDYRSGQDPPLSSEQKALTQSLDVAGTVLIFVEWEVVKWADIPFRTRPFGPLDKEEKADEPIVP